jgi:ribonuclease HII
MTILMGVEEAGRGPVIGPLVMAGVSIDEKDLPMLKKLGVKDSKQLSPLQRETLFDKIIAVVKDFKIKIISASQVDDALNDPYMNLNWLEAKVSADIINELDGNKVTLDCPSTNIEAYRDYVKKLLNKKNEKIELIAEHKADENYVEVAAASILAKVTRDREIEKLKEKYNIQFGSGYPADPRTKEFLEKNHNKYPIFRKTWKSYKNVIMKKAQKGLGDF